MTTQQHSPSYRPKVAQLYPKEVYAKLEFDKILEILEKSCQSALGKRHVAAIQPQFNPDLVLRLLTQTEEFVRIEGNSHFEFPTDNYLDLHDELALLRIEASVLTAEQIFRVFKVLHTTQRIVHFFNNKEGENQAIFPELYVIVQKIAVDKDLLNAIKAILDEEGRLRNNASSELQRIRKNISLKYAEINNAFRRLLGEFKKNNWLTEDEESVRNGRRVLAVPSELKRKIKGVILDESATGKTTFIEPQETLQLNNELFELQLEEKREIYRILKTLTAHIRQHHESLGQYQNVLGILDFIRAKAKLALQINGVKPYLSNDRTMEWQQAYHPLLLLRNQRQQKNTVPLYLRLSPAERVLVISGPNAGGKSVSLKTVGLLQLMLQTGLLVPVKALSTFMLFEQIFVDIGDEQSLENDLSTYSSKLINMKYFLDFANAKTLFLIDEFGSGTDPRFGGAIAESILEDLNRRFCYGVITTHYSNIKIFASETKGIINGAMSYSNETLQPLYRLQVGQPGSSYAFEIAQKSGLKGDILDKARQKVGADYQQFDHLLSSLQSEKTTLMQKDAEVSKLLEENKKLKQEYEEKSRFLDKNTKKILLKAEQDTLFALQQTNKRMENMLREFTEQKEKETLQQLKNEVQQERKILEEKIADLQESVFVNDKEDAIAIGSVVLLRDGVQRGTVLEINGDTALLEFGSLKTRAKLKELTLVQQPKAAAKVTTRLHTFERSLEFDATLDVRGLRSHEALAEVERLMDNALMLNADRLKIIHGKGDGILRKQIRQYLRKYPAALHISDEDPQYGGDGITIIQL
ncbi:MAG: endonuclease MutS2 [Sphingobacteriales bacterium]|nr:endonuclease MutS2 [Sphingobacteriales bacterium]